MRSDRTPVLSSTDFVHLRNLVQAVTGIRLADSKQHLVASRLWSRLRAHNLDSFSRYVSLLQSGHDERERQLAIDALTTHETSFFREHQHFPSIVEHAKSLRGQRKFRVWSAACSTGEEAWSIAMLLGAALPPGSFEVVGTDVSAVSVESARRALYTLDRSSPIPKDLLRRFCRKGQDDYEGMFLIDATLRQQVSFQVANLCEPQPASLGNFDVIVLRNVLIYFELNEKRLAVQNCVDRLLPGGLLLNGHAESVAGLNSELEFVAQTIHRRVRPGSAQGAS